MSDEQRTYYALTLGQGIAVDEIYEGEAEIDARMFIGTPAWDGALLDLSEKADAVIFIGDKHANYANGIYHPTKEDREAAVTGRFYFSSIKGYRANPTEVTVIKLENLTP